MGLVALALVAASYLLPVPELAELVALLRRVYGRHGYWVVLLGSLVEGTVVANWYFPGSTIVLLGAAFAREGVVRLPLVLGLAAVGFFLGASLNYLLGRYGWYRLLERLGLGRALEEANRRVARFGWRAVFLGYVNPALGVVLSTSAGILRLPYGRFLLVSLAAVVFWTVVWGTLAYWFGLLILELVSTYWWVWTVPLGAWLVWRWLASRRVKRVTPRVDNM